MSQLPATQEELDKLRAMLAHFGLHVTTEAERAAQPSNRSPDGGNVTIAAGIANDPKGREGMIVFSRLSDGTNLVLDFNTYCFRPCNDEEQERLDRARSGRLSVVAGDIKAGDGGKPAS